MQANAYLLFKGDCEVAFKFYEKTLHGKINAMMRHAGTPMEANTPPEWREKIIHANMNIGDTILMGSDAPGEHYSTPQGFSVCLNLADVAEAERVFKELSEGGEVRMAIQKTFWAERFAMFSDRFGIPWMINCGQHA